MKTRKKVVKQPFWGTPVAGSPTFFFVSIHVEIETIVIQLCSGVTFLNVFFDDDERNAAIFTQGKTDFIQTWMLLLLLHMLLSYFCHNIYCGRNRGNSVCHSDSSHSGRSTENPDVCGICLPKFFRYQHLQPDRSLRLSTLLIMIILLLPLQQRFCIFG